MHPNQHVLRLDGHQATGIPRVAQRVTQLLAPCLAEGPRNEVELALLEALNNAILHGCLEDKTVEIRVRTSPTQVSIELEYRGRELDRALLHDRAAIPARDPHEIATLPESGMGLAIIHAVMEQVRYEFEQGLCRWTFIKTTGDVTS